MSRIAGYYWKLIRYYVNAKMLVGLTLATPFFVLIAISAIRTGGAYSSEKTTTGVVMSSGPVDVGRACGGIQQFATVHLADGAVVEAFVDSSLPLKAGTVVQVIEDVSPCNGVGYIVKFTTSRKARKRGVISPPRSVEP